MPASFEELTGISRWYCQLNGASHGEGHWRVAKRLLKFCSARPIRSLDGSYSLSCLVVPSFLLLCVPCFFLSVYESCSWCVSYERHLGHCASPSTVFNIAVLAFSA